MALGGESGGLSKSSNCCADPVGEEAGDPTCVSGEVLLLLSLMVRWRLVGEGVRTRGETGVVLRRLGEGNFSCLNRSLKESDRLGSLGELWALEESGD